MKVKLSDTTQSQIEVQSVSHNFNAFDDNTTINITIGRTSKELEYFKDIFTDETIKTIVVLTDEGATMATLHGDKVAQINNNIQETYQHVSIQIDC